MKLPKLFKKTSTGAIQFWEINVDIHGAGFGRIETSYGQVGTSNTQVTEDIVEYGKNIGKKNETTPYEQAVAEAQAKWEKQLKKGYSKTIETAQNDETDELIEGGILPMLAHPYKKHAAKITYPAYVQPKLDGIRCIAIVEHGKCTLWSRSRKKIESMPHIVEEIESVFKGKDIVLDAELYCHSYKANFEHIVSLVRQEEPNVRCTDVEYHIYDIVSKETFAVRTQIIANSLHCYEKAVKPLNYLVPVDTVYVRDEEDVARCYGHWRQNGYEGAMIRNANGLYVNKRSYDLQKIKEFEESEFEIIGIDEGRGKLSGHVGSFVCRMESGKEFLAKMSGETAKLREYFDDHSLWRGKKLTVQYQGLTGSEKVPRFPVGKAIRDYE